MLVALLLAPVAFSYYRLLIPPPIPVAEPQTPNGFDRLRHLGQRLEAIFVPDIDTATQPQLAAFVKNNNALLQEVRAALELPFTRPLTYTEADITVDHMSELQNVVRALVAAGRLAEMEGRTDEAVANYLAAARLGRSVLNDGIVIDYLLGIALESSAIHSMETVRGSLSGRQSCELLKEIQGRLQPFPSPQPHLERDAVFDQHVGEWQSQLDAILRKFVEADYPFQSVLEDFHTRDQTTLNLLCTDLAVRCYEADQGRFPSQLSELSPDYLRAPLPDPCGGGQFIYRGDGKSFVLYSVGHDLDDDGGKAGKFLDPSGDLLLEAPLDRRQQKSQ